MKKLFVPISCFLQHGSKQPRTETTLLKTLVLLRHQILPKLIYKFKVIAIKILRFLRI